MRHVRGYAFGAEESPLHLTWQSAPCKGLLRPSKAACPALMLGLPPMHWATCSRAHKWRPRMAAEQLQTLPLWLCRAARLCLAVAHGGEIVVPFSAAQAFVQHCSAGAMQLPAEASLLNSPEQADTSVHGGGLGRPLTPRGPTSKRSAEFGAKLRLTTSSAMLSRVGLSSAAAALAPSPRGPNPKRSEFGAKLRVTTSAGALSRVGLSSAATAQGGTQGIQLSSRGDLPGMHVCAAKHIAVQPDVHAYLDTKLCMCSQPGSSAIEAGRVCLNLCCVGSLTCLSSECSPLLPVRANLSRAWPDALRRADLLC